MNMILEAEKVGLLKPGATIVEPTNGNTGIGLAMVGTARGYHTILVMPDTMTKERLAIPQGLWRRGRSDTWVGTDAWIYKKST